MARWSASDRAWLRVWVAERCWPSRSSTPARTASACPGGVVAAGAAGLPAAGVGAQGPGHGRPVWGDGLDAEQVTVGQRPAGLTRLDRVVVAGADDQVTGAGPGAVGDDDRGPVLDDAEGGEVLADPAV